MLVVSHVPAKRPAFMRSAIAAVVTVLTASAAVAAPPADTDRPERPGRYILQPVDGGVLRMDTESGAISLCVKRAAAVSCEPVPDERSGQKEVERLATENRELKADIKRLEEQMGLGDKPAAPGPPGGQAGGQAGGPPAADKPDGERPVNRSSKFNLPTEQDIDQALNYVERMMKKLREKWKDIEGSRHGTAL